MKINANYLRALYNSQQAGSPSTSSTYDPITRTGYIERKFPDGGFFRGYLKLGMRSGFGSYVYPDQSSVFEGQWQDDKCDGQGKLRDDES
ncbi:unnamed protein product, partial [Amoebophrya sp. A120]|eukprot:GSA120T00006771001.1